MAKKETPEEKEYRESVEKIAIHYFYLIIKFVRAVRTSCPTNHGRKPRCCYYTFDPDGSNRLKHL